MDKRTREAARYVIDRLGELREENEDVRIVCEFLEEEISEPETVFAIRLTEEDVRGAYRKKHGREPTEKEFKDCVSHLNGHKFLEAMDFKKGWGILDEIA